MKRALLVTGLLLALAACSGHTVHRLEVDLLSFLPQDSRQGTLNLTQASVQVPEDPAGQEVGVPGVEALVDARFRVQAELENTGATSASLSLEVRLGPKEDTNLYDGNGDIRVSAQTITLNPGEKGTLSLDLTLKEGDPGYDLVKSGAFRVGAQLSLSGEQVAYQITQAEVVLRFRLFNLIP
ncbi:hypothetical protein [Thermus sp.]